MTTDLAGGLLRMVVRTLPERQAEWGRAMRAELAGIADRGERWRFAAGCALALLGRPAGALAVGWWLVRAALLAAVVAFGWAIGALPLRIEALALVAGLVLGYALLRSRICFGPVAASRGARLATAGGILAVATEVMLQFHRLQVDPPSALPMNAMAGVEDPSRATSNLVALAVVLGVLLIALTQVTAGRLAVRPSTIATGAGAAGITATLWLAFVLVHPAGSTVGGPALLGVVAAGLVAGVRAAGLHSPPGELLVRVDDAQQGLVAGLLAAAGTTTAIGVLMDLLPLTGHWVVNDAPPLFAANPPTRVVDTVVVWLPALACMLALIVTIHRRQAAPLPEPA